MPRTPFMQAVKALLLADGTFSGLVGGVLTENVLNRGFALPAVAFHIVHSDTDYTMGGTTGLKHITVQFDTFADTADAGRQVGGAIDAVLEDFRGDMGGNAVQAVISGLSGDLNYTPDINKVSIGFHQFAQYVFHFA